MKPQALSERPGSALLAHSHDSRPGLYLRSVDPRSTESISGCGVVQIRVEFSEEGSELEGLPG